MKKLTGYFICFAGMCVVFTACYYLSYQRVLKQFLEQTSERDYKLMMELSKSGPGAGSDKELTSADISNEAGRQYEDALETGVTNIDIVKPDAKYILESYDIMTNQLVREEKVMPGEYVGMNREDIIKLLSQYMDDIPISEYEKGLFAFELLSFSKDEIIMRKSYNQDLVKYKYYIAVREGYVIVYYSDLKTVYEYTRILAVDLPEEERLRLMQGIYLNTNEELYELLESYSS